MSASSVSFHSFLHTQLYSRSFWQSPVQQLHCSMVHDTFEFLLRLDRSLRGRGHHASPRAFVHGLIRQAVRFLIVFA